MENNGWKPLSTLPKAGTILVWHVYQGVMVTTAERATENRFNKYWREVSDAWIYPHERAPEQRDADVYNCVIVRDKWDDVRLMGWHRFPSTEIAAWQSPPGPPSDYLQLLKEAD